MSTESSSLFRCSVVYPINKRKRMWTYFRHCLSLERIKKKVPFQNVTSLLLHILGNQLVIRATNIRLYLNGPVASSFLYIAACNQNNMV